jgi:putative hydrolase of the HAD superfamily
MALTTLFLDVDGVLINGRPSDGRNWAHDIQKDLGIDPKLLDEHFFSKHWSKIVTGQMGLRDALQESLPKIWPSASVEALLTYWFENDARLDTDLLSQVATVRANGVSVFLATNQEHLRASHLMNELGLSQHVDGMIYSAAVAAKKPEVAFYAACERVAGCAPSEAILVDDTLANIGAARKSGWRALHWTGRETLIDMIAVE